MTSTKRIAGLAVTEAGSGAGAPVLLLHSLGGDRAHYDAMMARLAPRRRVIAVDLPGHGASDALAGEVTIESMAQAVSAVIDAVATGSGSGSGSGSGVVLLGHSMGGAIAAACAALRPGLVRGLVLLDPASDGRDVPADAAAGMLAALQSEAYRSVLEEYWLPMLAPSSEAVRSAVMQGLWRTPREVVIACLGALIRFDPAAPFLRYDGPCLSLITAWNEVPGAVHRRVPRVRAIPVAGTGHWLHLDAPDVVGALVEAELDRLSGGGT